MATIVCPDHRPQMATVRPGVFEKLPLGENDATVENVEIKFNSNDIRTKIVEIIKEHKDIVDISEANVLVAGGRGIGSEENFKMLKELAEVMNGSISDFKRQ